MSTFAQLPHRSVSGDYRPAAMIRQVPEELSAQHPIDWLHYVEDGLGPALGAAFRASNGHYFGLEYHSLAPIRFRHTAILTLHQSPAEAETLDAALSDLGLTTADVARLRDDLQFTPCDLIRQDDHGNQFCVGTYRCRADALAAQRQLSASFHKQEYWLQVHADSPLR